MQRGMVDISDYRLCLTETPELVLTIARPRCCIQFKIKGYSKIKNADLVAKLLRYRASLVPDQTSTGHDVLQPQQSIHSESATPPLYAPSSITTPGEFLSSMNEELAASTSSVPTFIDGPYSAITNALVTPTAPPLRIGKEPETEPVIVHSSTAGSIVSSSFPTQSSPLLAHSTLLSRPIGHSILTKDSSALTSVSMKDINRNRKEDRRQGATSLKDAVAKQRETKRTAGEAGMRAVDGAVKRVRHG